MVGQTITQGQALFSVNGTPTVLLYGSTPAWRDLAQGVTGPDVAQLNADLVALGEATNVQLDPNSDHFESATATAVKRLQANLGIAQTGTLTFGQVAFLPTPARITTVSAVIAGKVQAGTPILSATSTTREVTATIDATQLSQLKVGEHATITLPGGQTTPATVASIGTVATAQSGGGSGSSSPPTVPVGISPVDPVATGTIDQASITVAVTTATVPHVLAIPVAALVASPGGQPAIDVVDPNGITQPEAVTLGLFDDANGLVQISGPGVSAGQTIALPSQQTTTT